MTEFQHILALIRNPGEDEVYHTFIVGLDQKYQQHLFQEGVQTLTQAVRMVRAFYLARGQAVLDALIPKPMGFARNGKPTASPELNRSEGRTYRSYSKPFQSSRQGSRSPTGSHHSRSPAGSQGLKSPDSSQRSRSHSPRRLPISRVAIVVH